MSECNWSDHPVTVIVDVISKLTFYIWLFQNDWTDRLQIFKFYLDEILSSMFKLEVYSNSYLWCYHG